MGILTGDLSPRSSGSAALGVEMVNGMGGFTTDIRPYSNVHMNSGIIHDPVQGTSGVLRFADSAGFIGASTVVGSKQDAIEISVDGGASFPLRLGGATDGFLGLGPHGVIQGLANAGSNVYILTSGDLRTSSQANCQFHAVSSIDFESNEIQFIAQGGLPNISLTSFGSLVETASVNIAMTGGRNISMDAGTPNFIGGQISMAPFDGSGQLEFRFGPHQAWYAKLTHDSAGGPSNDGFWPLPHSGQILQMISENAPGGGSVDLQGAYENGYQIFTTASQGGPVEIVGTDAEPLALYCDETGATRPFPHIQMSGLIEPLANGESRGGFYMQNHTAGWEAMLRGQGVPANQAEADARSLGPALPFYSTGSGITNIMVASGIGVFRNNSLINYDQNNPARLTATNNIIPQYQTDGFYTPVNGSGVVVNVPGTYRVGYIAVPFKSAGNYRQTTAIEVRVRHSFGREDFVSGTNNGVTLRNSDDAQFGSVRNSTLVDLDAGDAVYLKFTAFDTPLPDFDTVAVLGGGTTSLTLEYIGPQRLGKDNREEQANP